MSDKPEPVVLELAPLPREQIGPFFLLGVDKHAGPEEIEASWAQRVIWARKNQIPTALGDINWAREVINDPERRVRADATSLNVDLTSGVLNHLADQFSVTVRAGPAWRPLDVEKVLADYAPSTEVPATEEVRATFVVPEAPEDIPAAVQLLHQLVQEPLDPWAADLLKTL
jgi:hypothetical protein